MNAVAVIALFNSLLTAAEQLAPEVKALANKGQISVEDQAAMLAKYNGLKAIVEAGPFQGPEWKV